MLNPYPTESDARGKSEDKRPAAKEGNHYSSYSKSDSEADFRRGPTLVTPETDVSDALPIRSDPPKGTLLRTHAVIARWLRHVRDPSLAVGGLFKIEVKAANIPISRETHLGSLS